MAAEPKKKAATDAETETIDVEQAGEHEEPGKLQSENTLIIQTRQADRLVFGRPRADGKSAIIGLMRYATLVKAIYHCAKFDDPYADWALLQLEKEIQDSRTELRQTKERYEKFLESVPNVSLAPAVSRKPTKLTLNFSNPYAYQGAFLLAEYDVVAQLILTAHHYGLVPRDAKEKDLNLAGKAVRRVYNCATQYRHTGAKKADIEKKTARGLQAIEIYGPLPADVLAGETRASFAPSKVSESRVISRRVRG